MRAILNGKYDVNFKIFDINRNRFTGSLVLVKGWFLVNDWSHFDTREKCRIADALTRRIEAQIDPVRHTEIVGSYTAPLVVKLQKRNGMKRLLSDTH